MDIPEELRKAAAFHGHLCPGLTIGYRASRAAMERMGLARAYDEELVCVVENDSCSVDAVQFLAGCTFGKGNLVFEDHGKQVFTFASRRRPGKALRVSLKAGAIPPPGGDLDPAARREEALRILITAPLEDLFFVDEIDFELPGQARIHQSVLCDNCGEPTMETRIVESGGRRLCIPCSRGWNPPPR
ncbi:MAG: FmdE family protein [Actinomycetota bacterium]|nr:FmdE family protein [Actinomycetota bacterium]MDD5667844.1 FmdE family protein [Actinomycetota bacterium]